jgi:hypothetical protein
MAILVFIFLAASVLAVATHCLFDVREFLSQTWRQLTRGMTTLRSQTGCKTEIPEHKGLVKGIFVSPNALRGSSQLQEMAVVVCHFNPLGWISTRANYLQFLREMRSCKIPLFSVEVAFEGQSFVSANPFLSLKADSSHMLWQKERLLNYAIENLPRQFDMIALVDADILFLNPSWCSQAVSKLRELPVLQLFSRMHRLDQSGVISSSFSGAFASPHPNEKGQKILSPWIGGAWAVRRDVFPLYDRCILGGGDVANYEGWLGLNNTWLQRQMSPAELQFYNHWSKEATQRTAGIAGSLTGDCVHMYHGQIRHRAYAARHAITRRWGFDPALHVAIDSNGLLKWTEHCPSGLRTAVLRYFAARLEDG